MPLPATDFNCPSLVSRGLRYGFLEVNSARGAAGWGTGSGGDAMDVLVFIKCSRFGGSGVQRFTVYGL